MLLSLHFIDATNKCEGVQKIAARVGLDTVLFTVLFTHRPIPSAEDLLLFCAFLKVFVFCPYSVLSILKKQRSHAAVVHSPLQGPSLQLSKI